MARIGGGCLCGAVRYAVETDGGIVDFCHCRSCRRAGGAAAVAWLQVPPAAFAVVAGAARGFASSAEMTRHFCPTCGSQLYMTDRGGRSVGVTLGTLDDPEAVSPAAHGFDAERPSWLPVCDGLPRFDGVPPYDL